MIDCNEEEEKLVGEDALEDFGEASEEDILLQSRHPKSTTIASTQDNTLDTRSTPGEPEEETK